MGAKFIGGTTGAVGRRWTVEVSSIVAREAMLKFGVSPIFERLEVDGDVGNKKKAA